MAETEPSQSKSSFKTAFWVSLVAIFVLALLLSVLLWDIRLKLLLLTFFSVAILILLSYFQHQEKQAWSVSQEKLDKFSHFVEKSQDINRLIVERSGVLQFTLKLAEYFKEVLKASQLVVFYKKNKGFEVVLVSDNSISALKNIHLSFHDPLIHQLKSSNGPNLQALEVQDLDSEWIRKFLPGFQKGKVIPYNLKDKIEGLCFFLPDSLYTPVEKEFLTWGWENLKLSLEFQKQALLHKEQTKKLKEKLLVLENQPAQREFKKKLFDLETFLNSAQSLFTVLEEEGLLISYLNLVQQQTDCKFGLVYALDEKREHWIIKQSVGMDFKGSRHLNFPVTSKLALFLKTKPKPQNLSLATEELKKDPHLRNLLDNGIQLGIRLTSGGQFWGMMFLGEKANHSQYQEQDLELFFILCQILNSAMENLKQFKKIEELSYTDSLTSLYNYRYFYKRLIEETLRAKRFNRTLGLVMFDIDGFKTYNDTYGHQAGDRVLRQLGGLLLTTTRSIDIASRYGGEEFCIIMPEADSNECLKFMERLRRVIAHHPFKDEYLAFDHHITISVGGAIFPSDAKTVDKLIYCADMALLRAKNAGKNKAFLYYEQEQVAKR